MLTDSDMPAHVHALITKRWLASEYLDNGQWGVLTEDNEIVVGLSSRLTEELARHVADVHNAGITLSASEAEMIMAVMFPTEPVGDAMRELFWRDFQDWNNRAEVLRAKLRAGLGEGYQRA